MNFSFWPFLWFGLLGRLLIQMTHIRHAQESLMQLADHFLHNIFSVFSHGCLHVASHSCVFVVFVPQNAKIGVFVWGECLVIGNICSNCKAVLGAK